MGVPLLIAPMFPLSSVMIAPASCEIVPTEVCSVPFSVRLLPLCTVTFSMLPLPPKVVLSLITNVPVCVPSVLPTLIVPLTAQPCRSSVILCAEQISGVPVTESVSTVSSIMMSTLAFSLSASFIAAEIASSSVLC